MSLPAPSCALGGGTLATPVAAAPMSSPSMRMCMVSSAQRFTPTRFPTWGGHMAGLYMAGHPRGPSSTPPPPPQMDPGAAPRCSAQRRGCPAHRKALQGAAIVLALQNPIAPHLGACHQPCGLGWKLQHGGGQPSWRERCLPWQQCGQPHVERASPLLVHCLDLHLPGHRVINGGERRPCPSHPGPSPTTGLLPSPLKAGSRG